MPLANLVLCHSSPEGASPMRWRAMVFAIGLISLSIAVTGFASSARAAANFATKAKQAILIDAKSGAVLYQKNADDLVPPASMSKLMTLAVVFRALKSGQIRMDDKFFMSENAWRKGGAPSGTSAMFVPVNSEVTLEELLQGIIIQSGNDACIAIAEGMAGSEAAFAQMMEAEARRIGLKRSTFRNATGLYHPEHLMTARELAKLAVFLQTKYPEYYHYFSQKKFNYRRHKFFNRNPLLYLDIGVDGLKTGHLSISGYGLVASAVQDGRRLIAVINGLKKKRDRKSEGRKLLSWGFRSFTRFKLFDRGATVGRARVWGGTSIYLPLTGKGPVTVMLPRFPANQKLKAEIVYNGPLKPPIKKGDQVARLRVTSSTKAVNEVPLYAAEDVEKAGLVRRGLDSLVHMAFSWLP